MLKKFSITLLYLATLLLLVLAVLPHHHHEEVACIVVENCEQHNTENDQHTNHHSSEKGNDNCQLKADYITPQQIQVKTKSFSTDDVGKFSLVLLYVSESLSFKNDFTVAKPSYGKYISFFTSSDTASLYKGLRAPPQGI